MQLAPQGKGVSLPSLSVFFTYNFLLIWCCVAYGAQVRKLSVLIIFTTYRPNMVCHPFSCHPSENFLGVPLLVLMYTMESAAVNTALGSPEGKLSLCPQVSLALLKSEILSKGRLEETVIGFYNTNRL